MGINFLPLKVPIVIIYVNERENISDITSKFLKSIPEKSKLYKVPCLQFFHYISNHKTWKCLVHFHVYPSDSSVFGFFVYPTIFQYQVSPDAKPFEFGEPCTVPRIRILVLEKIKPIDWSKLSHLSKNQVIFFKGYDRARCF